MDEEQDRFVELWQELSDRLRDRPNEQVAYELMNEAVADDPEDPIPSGGLGVFSNEAEVGPVERSGATVFDEGRVSTGSPAAGRHLHALCRAPGRGA